MHDQVSRLEKCAHVGPVETQFGNHLVLVEERLGCLADEGKTRVVAQPWSDGDRSETQKVRSVVRGPSDDSGGVSETAVRAAPIDDDAENPLVLVALACAVLVGGGLVAEFSAWVGTFL